MTDFFRRFKGFSKECKIIYFIAKTGLGVLGRQDLRGKKVDDREGKQEGEGVDNWGWEHGVRIVKQNCNFFADGFYWWACYEILLFGIFGLELETREMGRWDFEGNTDKANIFGKNEMEEEIGGDDA